MKTFTKYFLIITVGIMLGYAWAASCYLPKIKALNTALATYKSYINQSEISHDR